MIDVPLLIEFAVNTKIYCEPQVVPKLPIVQNGPPGTFIVFPDGRRVSVPTDQVVYKNSRRRSAPTKLQLLYAA